MHAQVKLCISHVLLRWSEARRNNTSEYFVEQFEENVYVLSVLTFVETVYSILNDDSWILK